MPDASATSTRLLADDLTFAEGPRWRAGRLWFSDFYDHAVKTVDLDGRVRTMFEVAAQPSGLGWLPDGRMLIVSMRDRKLLRLEDDRLVEHADLGDVATYHCNDMVVDELGRAYVGNFGFDLDGEIDARGIDSVAADHPTAALAIVHPTGEVGRAAEGLHFPNGSVITADGRTLVVAETLAEGLVAFDIADDGSLGSSRPWASLPGRRPDGICLDAEGAIWVADPANRETVRVLAGGAITDRIETEHPPYACMLGGAEGTTLFVLVSGKSHSAEASKVRSASIRVTEVSVPHAGRP